VAQTFGKPLSIAASRGRLVIPLEYSSAALPQPQPTIVASQERLSIPPVVSLSPVESPVTETGADGQASILITQPQATSTPGLELSIVAEDALPFPEETVTQDEAAVSPPEETATPNGTATSTSFLPESAREDTTVAGQEEKKEKQEEAEVQPALYHFG